MVSRKFMTLAGLAILAMPVVAVLPGCGGGGGGGLAVGNSDQTFTAPIDFGNGQVGRLNLTVQGTTASGNLVVNPGAAADAKKVVARQFTSTITPNTYAVSGTVGADGKFSVKGKFAGELGDFTITGTIPSKTSNGSYTVSSGGQTASGNFSNGGSIPSLARLFPSAYTLKYDFGAPYRGQFNIKINASGAVESTTTKFSNLSSTGGVVDTYTVTGSINNQGFLNLAASSPTGESFVLATPLVEKSAQIQGAGDIRNDTGRSEGKFEVTKTADVVNPAENPFRGEYLVTINVNQGPDAPDLSMYAFTVGANGTVSNVTDGRTTRNASGSVTQAGALTIRDNDGDGATHTVTAQLTNNGGVISGNGSYTESDGNRGAAAVELRSKANPFAGNYSGTSRVTQGTNVGSTTNFALRVGADSSLLETTGGVSSPVRGFVNRSGVFAGVAVRSGEELFISGQLTTTGGSGVFYDDSAEGTLTLSKQ